MKLTLDQSCDCSLATAMCGKCSKPSSGTCPDYNSIYLRDNAGINGGGISSCLLGNNDANPFCWEGESCSSWGEHNIQGFTASTTNVCRDNSCAMNAPSWNGETCTVRKGCAAGVISSANGKWDNSEMKCVECSAISNKGEGKIFGDGSSIRIDCSGNPILGDGQCESACTSDALCDEKNVGDCIGATIQKCASSCAPVTSCGDGTKNCGEACEAGCTGTITKCNTACSASVTSCGDWINNCGEAVNTCRSDVCGTSSTRYNMNDLVGGSGWTYTTNQNQATCGLGTGFTGNNNDWFEVTTSQAGYLRLEIENIPFACDWDIYVYNTGLTELFKSITGTCMETATSPTILPAGTYLIKVTRVSGNGQGYLRVKLLECMIDTECKGTDGTWNTYCPKDSITPNYILPSCTANVCGCAAECSTNAECATNFCCTQESPQGPNAKLPGKTLYTCEPKSTIANPWLCT